MRMRQPHPKHNVGAPGSLDPGLNSGVLIVTVLLCAVINTGHSTDVVANANVAMLICQHSASSPAAINEGMSEE